MRRNLYLQVLVAIAIGVALGVLRPDLAKALKPLGDVFVKTVRMLIGPVIFCTVVGGLAGLTDLRRLGRVGWKALVYFEVVTTVALLIGLVVAKVVQPQLRVQVHARSTPSRELVRLPLRLKRMKPRRPSAAREQ